MNEEVDVVCQTLNITNADAVMNWKQVLEADQRIQQELMASSVDDAQVVLKELQDTRSQLETILTLKFETEQRSEQQSPEMTKLLKTMMGTVIRASMTSVPKLPPWFLPPYEIHFNPEPFARGSFATLHRGVWGADTNVVVKCFLVDGVEVDERTRQNIEAEMNIWYQFDHPNVAKLLGASHISTPPFIVGCNSR
ncbi:unnamed protein product [Phytophthora lilii]|uniref:Unnamed protein product n=1 Tax=Phytophthora lilii TaxID=2077276 RepID=A0A9W6TW80_9STRA|nr:unnamed protein product [Phytophthora lilii]